MSPPRLFRQAALLATLCVAACGSSCRGTNGAAERPAHRPVAARAPAAAPATRLVERVIDGDTVILNGGTRVRVTLINTPEIDEELGLEAKRLAMQLVEKKMVRVAGNGHDHYGRLLGDVIVDGKSLAEALVAAGMAHVFLIPPVDRERAERLLALQREARAARKGIWATARYQGSFHITSFHANPRGNDNFNLNGEYVRIACIADAPASLEGYRLENKRKEAYRFGPVTVPPGYTIVVHSGHGKDQLDPRKQLRVYWNRSRGAWSNKGDTATLIDATGAIVDQVVYDPHKRKDYTVR